MFLLLVLVPGLGYTAYGIAAFLKRTRYEIYGFKTKSGCALFGVLMTTFGLVISTTGPLVYLKLTA